MITTLLALVVSTASAADSNEDGCVDSFFDANSVCVSTDATIATGLTIGSGASVAAFADIGPDVTLGQGVIVASRSIIAGRLGEPGASAIGNNSIVGRAASIGVDSQIGADVTLGRNAQMGARLQAGDTVQVGYANDIGDDVELSAGAVLGALVSVGDHTFVQPGTVMARGTQVADAASALEGSDIGGIIGPDVSIGSATTIDPLARIRKRSTIGDNVTIGQNVRIARDVTVEYDAIIGDNVTIRAGAVIGHGATLVDGTFVGRDEVIDPVASGLAVVAQHTSTTSPYQTVYRLEPQTVPSSGDARVWYQTSCEDAGLRPVSCDYNNWGPNYNATAWNAVILEKTYWSCNVSSGIQSRTGWSGVITFHVPSSDGNGIYATSGESNGGAVGSMVCTD